MRSRNETLGFGGALAFVGMASAVVFGTGPIADANYGDTKALHDVEGAGYTNVVETGKTLFFAGFQGCGPLDAKYDFDAIDSRGMPTHVLVCKGLIKGATIRLS